MEYKLRKWTNDDIKDLTKIANSKDISDKLEDNFPNPYTKKDAELFLTMTKKADPAFVLMYCIEIDGKPAGSISIIKIDDVNTNSAKIGFWLAKKYWRKGIMSNVIKEVTAIAFKKFNVIRVNATVFNNNTAARIALENAGYNWEGTMRKAIVKNEEFHDAIIYGFVK